MVFGADKQEEACVSGQAAEYKLINLDNGLTVVSCLRIAGDSATRRKGLLGVQELDRDSGLWIMPCEAIHTFGLKMPIDVLFLDREFRVKKLLEGLRPLRISVCLQASSVVEMRAGAIADSKTTVGHRLGVDSGQSITESVMNNQ